MNKVTAYIKMHWISMLIVCLPILDIVTYFFINTTIASIFTLLRFLLLPIIYIYAFIISKNKKSHYIFSLIMLSYSLLHALSCYLSGYVNIVEDISNLLRILYMPILLFSFVIIFKNHQNAEKEVVQGMKIAFIITALSIVLALFTNTATYAYSDVNKIGLIGWFYSKNSQTLILIALSLITGTYCMKHKTFYLFFPVIIILLYFNATKAAFFSLLVFILFCIFYLLLEVKNKKKALYVIIALLIVIGTFKISPTYKQLMGYVDHQSNGNEQIKEEINKPQKPIETQDKNETYDTLYRKYSLGILIDNFGLDRVLGKYNSSTDAFIIGNTRTKKKIAASLIYDDESKFSHIVGFEFTKINSMYNSNGTEETLDLENDITALYYYLGYAGIALYFGFIAYFLVKIVISILKNPKYILKSKYMIWVMLSFLLIIAGEFNGALLRRPSANIYLAIILTIATLKFDKENINKHNDI